jgi:beta-lactamase class A
MLKSKVSIFYLVFTTICASIISILAFKALDKSKDEVYSPIASVQGTNSSGNTHLNISRLNGYKYIHPIYSVEADNESSALLPLKTGIGEYLESMKSGGDLTEASVYIKDLTSEDWTIVNPNEQYRPGSLIKVITMITYLRMAEANPALLDKEITYNNNVVAPTQTFNSKVIEPGKKYKIRELIRRMIAYSDNNATALLHKDIDIAVFQKTFTDIGLNKPNVTDKNFTLDVKYYSRFISVLYEGSYLTLQASEYAISLLSEGDFKLGILKQLPATMKVAHKFGEAGTPESRELHESAIVYLNDKPYLLTVMTKGKDARKLADIISEVSKLTYDYMNAKPV